jgi:ATP-dependent helicase Lhr and Lhr-like helicase
MISVPMERIDGLARVEAWFASQGWEIFDFQREVWDAYAKGESGLVHSATGTGKTFAAWFAPIVAELARPSSEKGLKVLWLTPLRALAADTAASLSAPLAALGLDWAVETRTGDTTSSQRKRQATRMPAALVTTPESLSLMFAKADHAEVFRGLQLVVVDEWHELMSTKRGTQTELVLAHLRRLVPGLRTWGVSATLGNLDEAGQALVGSRSFRIVKGLSEKQTEIDTVLPESVKRFPWAGHYGTSMIPRVIEELERSGTSLVFTNTRAQAEIWFRQILDAKPEWADTMALHHGSLSQDVRDEVELGLKTGRLRAVVCTSSLDLGVDFSPVERVLQVGSPKGVARLLQRAGRSGHRPGVPSCITCVPTHALELIDLTAARFAALEGKIEPRHALAKPLDVLAQHLVTIACGDGFEEDSMRDEVRSARSFHDLTDEEWQWTIDFIVRGGSSLRAYPEYHKVVLVDGRYRVTDNAIAQRHRMSIGTIVSDAAMTVRYMTGGALGTVEESFLSRLSPGDKFIFAGRPLQFVRIKEMTAWVKPARSISGSIPRWAGGRLPLSNELATAIRRELDFAKNGELRSPEMEALAPLLEIQARWSAIPGQDEILIERVEDKEGFHLFFYPMEGRLVHEGLAALFAYRIARHVPITFSMACNDYGFELLSQESVPLHVALTEGLFSRDNLLEDIAASLNEVEMARRQFREIARVAGLVFQGYPGASKSLKQVQSSSGLLFDVFQRYDPENMLIRQAHREVLERQLEETRLAKSLQRLEKAKLLITEPPRPTPLAFPILIDRLRETLTSESISDRIEKLAAKMEREADAS